MAGFFGKINEGLKNLQDNIEQQVPSLQSTNKRTSDTTDEEFPIGDFSQISATLTGTPTNTGAEKVASAR